MVQEQFGWRALLGVSWGYCGQDTGGLQTSEGLTGAGGSTSKVINSYDWEIGAGCWPEATFFLMWVSPLGCLSGLTTWLLVSPKAGDPRK